MLNPLSAELNCCSAAIFSLIEEAPIALFRALVIDSSVPLSCSIYPFTAPISCGTRSCRCFNCTSISANAFSRLFLSFTKVLYIATIHIRTMATTMIIIMVVDICFIFFKVKI